MPLPSRRTLLAASAALTLLPRAARAADVPAPETDPRPVLATAVQIVADDFVADIHLNGKLIPAERRTLQDEVYGAQVERVAIDLRTGDFLVFNVVNNFLRWGGARYFAAAILSPAGLTVAGTSAAATNSPWSATADLAQAAKFVADSAHLADKPPALIPPDRRWDRGDKTIAKLCPDYNGDPVWAPDNPRSAWIKFVVPPALGAANGGI